MRAPDTPKFSGPHRRWNRPFGQVSRFTTIASIVVGLLIILLVIVVLLNWTTLPRK